MGADFSWLNLIDAVVKMQQSNQSVQAYAGTTQLAQAPVEVGADNNTIATLKANESNPMAIVDNYNGSQRGKDMASSDIASTQVADQKVEQLSGTESADPKINKGLVALGKVGTSMLNGLGFSTKDGSAGQNWQSGAQLAGTVADIAKASIKLNENQAKYGAAGDTASSSILSTVSSVNPIFKAAVSIGQAGSKFAESKINYDKYGRTSTTGSDATWSQVSASFTPDKTLGAANKSMKEAGLDPGSWKDVKYAIGDGNFWKGFGAWKQNIQNKVGDWRAKADEVYQDKMKVFKESQGDINESRNRFLNAKADASYIYGNNGQMRVALRGGIIGTIVIDNSYSNVYRKIAYHYTMPNVEIKRSNIILGLKKGGSIIPGGVLHSESNNIGDHGIPIVFNGYKVMEIEKDEFILRKEISSKIKELREQYAKSKDDDILNEIGELMIEEMKNNTFSFTKKYACLNNNTCTI